MITKEYIIKQKNNRNAITLISLVLTIVILMILATIITVLVVNNQFIDLTKNTKVATITEQLREEKEHYLDGKKLSSDLNTQDNTPPNATEFEQKVGGTFEFKNNILYYNNQKTNITKAQYDDWFKYQPPSTPPTPPTPPPTIPKDLKVGDTIIYNPTKGVTDTSKLTYTSQKGTAKTSGNGYGTQTVTIDQTAKEWVVISIHNNQIKVMSKEPVKEVTGGEEANKFTLKGGIGWLYAEEELHKACSIYGYGKGAKQVVTTYQIGNYQVPGEAQTRILIGSGARSMTMEDIVKIMKGEAYTDFTDAEKKLLDIFYKPGVKSREERYPTINGYYVEYGTGKDIKKFDNEFYSITSNSGYSEELVPDIDVKENKTKLKNYIFKDNSYFLASPCIFVNMSDPEFNVRYVRSSSVWGDTLVSHRPLVSFSTSAQFLRPVVYLDGKMLEKQSEGIWKIKD
ncbi:MAG: type II secretion system protein [Clostridium sp.]